MKITRKPLGPYLDTKLSISTPLRISSRKKCDPQITPNTCKEIFKGWNYIANNKSNAGEIVKWRWQPKGCDLPPFDPASSGVKKWRPAGADCGYTFLDYKHTIACHRTNLLVCYGRWSANANGGELESLGYKEGYRVDVHVPEGTWTDAPSFHDILIFNTGH